jgi:hypothetical protein
MSLTDYDKAQTAADKSDSYCTVNWIQRYRRSVLWVSKLYIVYFYRRKAQDIAKDYISIDEDPPWITAIR